MHKMSLYGRLFIEKVTLTLKMRRLKREYEYLENENIHLKRDIALLIEKYEIEEEK